MQNALTHRYHLASLFLVLFTFALPQPLWSAASTEHTDSFWDLPLTELAEVQVYSATEFNDSRLNVPATVSVMGEEDWLKLGARQPRDVIAHLPGVKLLPVIAGGQGINIRGYANHLPRGVSLQLDGVPLNSYAFNTSTYHMDNIGLLGLERIEVLRGPGSVQYGTDAFHGIASYHSYAATKEESQIFSELGSDSFRSMGARTAQTVAGHWLHASLQGSWQGDQDISFNYTDPNNGQAMNGTWAKENEYYMGIATIRSDWSDVWYYDAGIYWKKDNTSNYPGYGRFFSSDRSTSVLQDRDLYSDTNDFFMTRARLGRHLEKKLDLEVFAYYWRTDLEHLRWKSYESLGLLSKDESRTGVKFIIKQENEAWQTRWSLSFEYDYAEIHDARDVTTDADGSLVSDAEENYAGFDRTVGSAVFQGRTDFVDAMINLHYGFRVDDYDSFGQHVSPRIGLVYNVTPDSAVKLLYGHALRAASAGEQGGVGTLVKGTVDLEPEIIESYELIYMVSKGRWHAELIGFQNFWENGITTAATSDPGYLLEYINSEEHEAYGVETVLGYTGDNWRFDYSGSYVRSRNNSQDTEYVAFPQWIHNVGFGYDWPDFPLNISVTNRVETNTWENPSESSEKLDTFWQTDLTILYTHKASVRWQLAVFNLFDRHNEIPASFFAENGLPAERLHCSLTMAYSF